MGQERQEVPGLRQDAGWPRADAHPRESEASAPSSGWRSGPRSGPWARRAVRTLVLAVGLPATLLAACAILFVGSDVVERHLFPGLSTGWRHFLLTFRAAIVTAVSCGLVYWVMRRQQRRIERTADELAHRLEAYHSNNGHSRFVNPHWVRCRDVIDCTHRDCRMYDVAEQPCWQRMALARVRNGERSPIVTIQQCHDCDVYRQSCPDGLTRLGESFNSLLFMLDEEADEVRRMNAQLMEKEKMVAIGQLASGIAHEISNPLSSISSIVQMLKRKRPAPLDPEPLDLMQTHIQRISNTVRQLGALSRPAADRWERVDWSAVLTEAVSLVAFDRRARQVNIRLQRATDLPPTYAVRGQMQQVFLNLCLNALDAMPNGGELAVSARCTREGLRFEFGDTGCGVPEDLGRRIFEPFVTTKEPGRGTGLGLSVSYGIVQKHGGRIDFVPREGGGTTFIVDLPALESAPTP